MYIIQDWIDKYIRLHVQLYLRPVLWAYSCEQHIQLNQAEIPLQIKVLLELLHVYLLIFSLSVDSSFKYARENSKGGWGVDVQNLGTMIPIQYLLVWKSCIEYFTATKKNIQVLYSVILESLESVSFLLGLYFAS